MPDRDLQYYLSRVSFLLFMYLVKFVQSSISTEYPLKI